MYENISMLRVSGLMAKHASASQKTISENIANADTPNYSPRGVSTFSDFVFEEVHSDSARQSRSAHLEWDSESSFQKNDLLQVAERKPNGNSVSVEIETMKSVEVERQHSQALAIYQHSIDLLKTSLGRGR